MIWEAHRLGGATSGLSHAMIWEAHRLGGTTSGLSHARIWEVIAWEALLVVYRILGYGWTIWSPKSLIFHKVLKESRKQRPPISSWHGLWLGLRRYLIVFDPLTFVLDSWSMKTSLAKSCSLTELTRQITPPTKNGHAPAQIESRKNYQSINFFYVWTAPLLAVPFRQFLWVSALRPYSPRNPKTLYLIRWWKIHASNDLQSLVGMVYGED